MLNFKNLDYKTQWLEFPDIKPTLEEQLAQPPLLSTTQLLVFLSPQSAAPFLKLILDRGFPTPAEGAMYTVPAILLQPASSSSTKPVPIMDSLAIAKALEEIHPKPSLYLDAPELTEASNLIDRLRMLIAPVALPMITREVLNPKSVECKEKGFFPKFGMTLDEFEKTKGGDPMWERMRPGLEELAGLMKKQDGPFVLGHTGQSVSKKTIPVPS